MAEAVTFSSIKNDIASRRLAPVYLLHGEEGYYTDALVKMFEELLPPEERDFNMYTLYAPQVDADTVMDTCRRYPMMSEFQVVILKEAQSVSANYLNALKNYASAPSTTTVLVISCRGAQAKAKDLVAAMKTGGGIVFESKKLNDRSIAPVIRDFIREKGLNIEAKALAMLQDYVGSDLSRIYNEIDKLTVILGPGAMVTPESIERNIGVSKDYNNFELISAIAAHDDLKAYRIVDYFRRNPKNNPTVLVATILFNYFSNMLVAYYAPDKSDRGMMAALGFKSPYALTDIKRGMNFYKPWQVIEIISAIRRFDCNSKGIGSRKDQYDLLQELIFVILNCTGRVKV